MAPTILITGFTGGLGASVLSTLLTLVPAQNLAVSSSNPSGSSRLPDKDITFHHATYDSLTDLTTAFQGIQKLFFVSSPAFDSALRERQHRNVIEAAKAARVGHVYYSSLAFGGKGNGSKIGIQQAHIATEQMLEESGLQYTSIREGSYADAFPLKLNWYPNTTDLYLPADGPIAYASRTELGEASAKLILRDDLQSDRVVLLTGPRACTIAEMVDAINRVLGKKIVLHRVSFEEYVAKNAEGDQGGKPRQFFENWKTFYQGVEAGDGKEVDPLMEILLGRRPKSGVEVVEELLRGDQEYTWHQNYTKI